MHMSVPTRRALSRAAIKAALAAACAVGLVLAAGLNEAEAAKGGKSGGTWGAATKVHASKVGSGTWKAERIGPVVRDHRGTPQVLPPPQGPRPGSGACARWPSLPGCRPIVRDHRGPRVVPQEDPPQKW
jgi:hypothetical protein